MTDRTESRICIVLGPFGPATVLASDRCSEFRRRPEAER